MTKYYKGFNADMKCLGFQFEEGKTYEEPHADLCKNGFHACEHPLNVFDYYSPHNSQYHEVELEDVSPKRSGDTKVCAKKITVGAKLTIAKLVDAAVEYTFEKSHPEDGASATGYQGAASATGYQGAASATGNQGAASATGDRGAASATGNRGAASATGNRGAASATGIQGAAVSLGLEGKAQAALGGFITLAEWKIKNNEWQRVSVKSRKVDGAKIKANTYYMLKGGKFVEA